MLKDIKVDPIQLKAALDARHQIRAGFDKPTAGMAAGMTQVNMISVPKAWAYDFLLYAHRNPQSCPVLDVLEEGIYATKLAADSDIRTDFPRYRIWKDGEMVDEVTDASAIYNAHPDLVTFLIGCSFSFETALQDAGIEVILSVFLRGEFQAIWWCRCARFHPIKSLMPSKLPRVCQVYMVHLCILAILKASAF